VALLIIEVARTVLHGLHAESFTILNVIVPLGLHTLEVFCKVTPVNFDFVGVNCCAWYCATVENERVLLIVSCDWSILSVLPTAVNDTREGEGVTRELATGSITSSRVMELMSNQASETFQAKFCEHKLWKNKEQVLFLFAKKCLYAQIEHQWLLH